MNQPMRNYLSVGLISFMAYPKTMGGEGPILESIPAHCRGRLL
jgi:hypothetical protein